MVMQVLEATHGLHAVVGIVMFVIVFVFSLEALKTASVFGEVSRVVIAACTAMLSVLGIWSMISTTSKGVGTTRILVIDLVLFPHIILPFAILLLLLLKVPGVFRRVARKRKDSLP